MLYSDDVIDPSNNDELLEGEELSIVDEQSEDPTLEVEVPGCTTYEQALALLQTLIQDTSPEQEISNFGSAGKEAPIEIEKAVLDLDEDRCQIINAALTCKAKRTSMLNKARWASWNILHLKKERTLLEKRRPTLGVWTIPAFEQLTKIWHSKWCQMNLAIDRAYSQAKVAWSEYKAKADTFKAQEAAWWNTYKNFMSLVGHKLETNQGMLAILRSQEINRWETSGYGSEAHDLQWAKGGDPLMEIEDEFVMFQAYWKGMKRLPAKGFYKRLRRSEQDKYYDSLLRSAPDLF